jgi:hypothetical protein
MSMLPNFIGGEFVQGSATGSVAVVSPSTGETIALVPLSTAKDVADAVVVAKAAFEGWSGLTIKARAAIMFRFHSLVETHAQELAEIIVRENGKNITEVGLLFHHTCLIAPVSSPPDLPISSANILSFYTPHSPLLTPHSPLPTPHSPHRH